jgi:hypothetical protein
MSDFQNYYQEDSRDPYKEYTQKDSGGLFKELNERLEKNKDNYKDVGPIILTGDPHVKKGINLEEYKPYLGEKILMGQDIDKQLAEEKWLTLLQKY